MHNVHELLFRFVKPFNYRKKNEIVCTHCFVSFLYGMEGMTKDKSMIMTVRVSLRQSYFAIIIE